MGETQSPKSDDVRRVSLEVEFDAEAPHEFHSDAVTLRRIVMRASGGAVNMQWISDSGRPTLTLTPRGWQQVADRAKTLTERAAELEASLGEVNP